MASNIMPCGLIVFFFKPFNTLQVRSRRYERIDDAFAEDSLDEIFTSTSYKATDVALTIFLIAWFGMGNYWVYRIYQPNYHAELYKPNDW